MLALLLVALVATEIRSQTTSPNMLGRQKQASSVAKETIEVYPVGINKVGSACAYIVKDGTVWFCTNTVAHKVNFN
ncbi:MAG: hypothetical protein GWN62_24835 [Aliifodinibius sp.]|nr:hypothetical protein [Fodinibius sp.]